MVENATSSDLYHLYFEATQEINRSLSIIKCCLINTWVSLRDGQCSYEDAYLEESGMADEYGQPEASNQDQISAALRRLRVCQATLPTVVVEELASLLAVVDGAISEFEEGEAATRSSEMVRQG